MSEDIMHYFSCVSEDTRKIFYNEIFVAYFFYATFLFRVLYLDIHNCMYVLRDEALYFVGSK